MFELPLHEYSTFATLTFEDEHLPRTADGLPTLDKRGAQRFFKRLRHNVQKCRYPVPLRHLTIGEYGPRTLRPHLHSIIFGLCGFDAGGPHEDAVKRAWGFGHVDLQPVNDKTIHYVAAGHAIGGGLAEADLKGREAPFALRSRNPGIGAGAVPALATAMANPSYRVRGPWLAPDGKHVCDIPPGVPDVLTQYRRGGKLMTLPPYMRSKVREHLGLPERVSEGRTTRVYRERSIEALESARFRERAYGHKLALSGKKLTR